MSTKPVSGLGGAAGAKKKIRKETSGDKLKAKEEEYRRLNAELEAKTSELVKEADQLLTDLPRAGPAHVGVTTGKKIAKRKPGAVGAAGKISRRPASSMAVGTRKSVSTSAGRAVTALQGARGEERPPPTRTSGLDPDLLATIRRLEMAEYSEEGDGGERGSEEGGERDVVQQPARAANYEDLLPPAVDDMGSEATIRFLKAKLRVMQEEMDSLCQDYSTKDKLIATQEVKVKELEAARSKLERSLQSGNNQLAKHKKMADELKHKCEGLEGQLTSLRKDYDAVKLSQKKASNQQGAMDVRLNRALEEVEKFKTALQSTRNQAKEEGKVERDKVEQLTRENKRLEKQKSELVTAFKKQMKLIDVLKRQKMHIEAAKLLSFSEDEFMKALDWGND